jgi:chromosome segregation ATPase
MPHDPRTLLLVFDDLSQLLLRWTTSVERFAEETSIAAIQAGESVAGLQRQSRHLQDIAAEMERLVYQMDADCCAMLEDATTTREFAHEHYKDTSAVVSKGEDSERSWRAGLGRAQDQLARARNELNIAQTALSAAQHRLSKAQSELRYAESALSTCRNTYRTDQQGRRIDNNCNSEAARVSRANSEVQAAHYEVSVAQAEVNRAQAEVNRSVRLVVECESGLSRAQGIVRDARVNLTNSSSSLHSASRAIAEAEGARQFQREAEEAKQRLGELAQEATIQVALLVQLGQSLPIGRSAIEQLSREQADLHLSARNLLAELDTQLRAFDTGGAGL